MTALLEVSNLEVSFLDRRRRVSIIEDISFSIRAGERVGVIGESGSGKSTLGLALLRLLPDLPGLAVGGAIRFDGEDVLAMSGRQLSAYRGASVATIFQDPMTALNPTMRIGRQIRETAAMRDRTGADAAVVDALSAVGIADAPARARAYPHHLSGGMRQRVVGAIGLARSPRLLIADEPTTALDVTVQLQVLDLIDRLSAERGMALMLISHDLSVVARLCERVVVMYAGQVVENGPLEQVLGQPRHWYTAALVACARSMENGRDLAFIPGRPPGLNDRPAGCRFQPRCPSAQKRCVEQPALQAVPEGRLRCWFPKAAP